MLEFDNFDQGDESEEFEEHICDVCHENEAIIYVKIVSEEGHSEEKGLCPSCAIQFLEKKDGVSELSLVDEKLVNVIQEMKDLLSGIVSNISAISMFMNQSRKQSEQVCPDCGLDFEVFKETGYLGCPYCYHAFREQIMDFLFEVQRGTVHIGKMPARFARLFVLKKEINFLRGKLRRLIHQEQYEEAEKVKVKLQKLIGNHPSGSSNALD